MEIRISKGKNAVRLLGCKLGIGFSLLLVLLLSCKNKTEITMHEYINGDSNGANTMALVDIEKFHNSAEALGFFHLSHRGAHYFVSLDRVDDAGESTFTIFNLEDRRLQKIREIAGPSHVNSLDGQIFEDKVIFCAEVNGWEPLQWFTQHASGFLPVESRTDAAGSNELTTLSIGMTVSEPWFNSDDISLPSGEMWNVATPLSPSSWLFGPKFIHEDVKKRVIVNTADGNMAVLEPPNGNPPRTELIRISGFRPQAVARDTGYIISYLKYPAVVYPFGVSLLDTPGELNIVENEFSDDLSSSLGLGALIAQNLVISKQGKPWIFALREAAVGTDLIAIEQTGQGNWSIRSIKTLSGDMVDIKVYQATDEWLVVLREYKASGSSLWQLFFSV